MSKLYLISPPNIEDPDAFYELLDQVLATGKVPAFQLRLKDIDDEDFITIGLQVVDICHKHHTVCIINDRVHLLETLDADGVHIGQDDGPSKDDNYIKKLRKKLGGDAIIGISCYGSRDYAMHGAVQGADYVAFGAFYPTTTKEPKARPTPDILEWWSSFTTVPVCAIGGITADNCEVLVKAGANFIAVVSYVWNHPKGPVAAVSSFSLDNK